MNKLTMFIIGAATGSVVTWQYLKNKYEKIAQEEIESVKAMFCKKNENYAETQEEPTDAKNSAKELTDYASLLQKNGYTDYSNMTSKKEEDDDVEKPYVIPPEEFGELDGYNTVSLTYFADNVLVDDNNEIVDDVEGIIGFESLTHFGEYEDDSVFVRNDRLCCDYEILQDTRTYSEVLASTH